MQSNEDVDWGVIFSEASVCVWHRHVFEQKPGGGSGTCMNSTMKSTHTRFTHGVRVTRVKYLMWCHC